MLLLVASLVALMIGPLVYGLLSTRHNWLHLIDGFIFVTMVGLVVTGIMPEAYEQGGGWVFGFAILGLLLPSLSERSFRRFRYQTHVIALVLGLTGLLIHAMADGTALADGGDKLLSWGVLLHRFPIGLTIWWFLRPNYGTRFAAATLVLIGVGTVLGFGLAPQVATTLSLRGMAWFQAFVAGSLLHVVFHRPHAPGAECGRRHRTRWYEGAGNLVGGALLVYLFFNPTHLVRAPWMIEIGRTLTDLALQSAPALLLAYVIGSMAAAFMPQSYIEWMTAGRSWKESARGVLVGLPLPVCSCGVIPLYHTLIKRGAPPAAAMAFLIATPELGLDAILLSLPLLGVTMTLVRVVAAALVALTVGIVIGRVTRRQGGGADVCCDDAAVKGRSWSTRLKTGFGDGLSLVDHTGPWILVGLVVAAVAYPLLELGGLGWVQGPSQVLLFALLGMPIYVCASGATPLVAVFLATGVSPGAALAFLLTGPATNVTTFGVLSALHGKRTALLFGLMTLALTVMLGYLTNLLLPHYRAVAVGENHVHGSWLQKLSLMLLLTIYLGSMTRRGARSFFGELFSQGAIEQDHQRHPEQAPQTG